MNSEPKFNINVTQEELRKEVLKQLFELRKEDIHPYIFHRDDTLKQNYTITIVPPPNTLSKMSVILDYISDNYPRQYVYDLQKLHITILGNINIEVPVKKVVKSAKDIIKSSSLEFELLGMGSNEHVSSFTAYPNQNLRNLRDKLRKELGIYADDYTKWITAYEYLGWLNCLRYRAIPDIALLNYIKDQRDEHFGYIKSPKVQILRNTSKTLQDGSIEIVDEFRIE